VTSSPAKPHSDLEAAAQIALFIDPWYSAEALRCVAKPEAEYIAQASPARILSLIGEARELQRLLEDLTPGGSEFHDDPQRCAQYVRERLATVARVQAENRRLRAALQVMVDVFHPSSAPDDQGHVEHKAYENARRALAGESQ
jgi:hypothetical protein